MNKKVHAGLGKCATTSLQSTIFPTYCRQNNLDYYPQEHVFSKEIRNNLLNPTFSFDILKRDNWFISCEGILGWNPGSWLTRLNRLAEITHGNIELIITVRKPSHYAYSCFIQQTLHNGYIVRPCDFFVRKHYTLGHIDGFSFDLSSFDLAALENNAYNYFSNVRIEKFEDLIKGRFLEKDYGPLVSSNKSLGQRSYHTMWWLQNKLSYLGLSFRNNHIDNFINTTSLYKMDLKARRFPFRRLLQLVENGEKIAELEDFLGKQPELLEQDEIYSTIGNKVNK